MKKVLLLSMSVLLALSLVGCAGKQISLREKPSLKKMAVVSLSVSDWGGSVKYGSVGNTSVNKLIEKATQDMLAYSEQTLSKRWEIKPAASFISGKAYQKEAVSSGLDVFVPTVKGKAMPLFTNGSGQIKRGDLVPAKAKALCRCLDVDAVVLVFSEWTYRTGVFVPLTKALSKNIVSVWDKNGTKLAMRRVDKMGTKTLGAMGIKAVNETTINEWVDTYKSSFSQIVKQL